MKTETIPVVVGALELIKKILEKVTSRIPGNINTNEIQKITMLGTAHILKYCRENTFFTCNALGPMLGPGYKGWKAGNLGENMMMLMMMITIMMIKQQ